MQDSQTAWLCFKLARGWPLLTWAAHVAECCWYICSVSLECSSNFVILCRLVMNYGTSQTVRCAIYLMRGWHVVIREYICRWPHILSHAGTSPTWQLCGPSCRRLPWSLIRGLFHGAGAGSLVLWPAHLLQRITSVYLQDVWRSGESVPHFRGAHQ